MKILIISQYFHPEFAVIPNELARVLAEKGHNVKVITGFPNYPSGRVFPGYKQRFRQTETFHGAQILRVPYWMNRSRNPILRTLSYLSFGFSSATAFKFAKDVDVIYVYATQMTAAIAPDIWTRMGLKIPFVLHIQDLWPESVTQSGMIQISSTRIFVNKLLTFWITSVYANSSKIISIAPTMKNLLLQRGVPEPKVNTVFNWADENRQENLEDHFHQDQIFSAHQNSMRFVYSGNLGAMQNLEVLIRAFSKLPEDAAFHLYFVGTGTKESELKALASQLGLSKVSFVGRVAPSQMGKVYEFSNFQIVSLKPLDIFRGTIPSKFQSALQAGVPVISVVEGDVNSIVDKEKIGFSANANDEESIVKALNQALDIDTKQMIILSNNARKYYEANMSISSGISRIESILSEVIQYQGGEN